MQKTGNYRWVVVLLLFFATTINYVDRQVIGLLKDDLAVDLNWSETDYSRIVMAFTIAYATGLFLFGRIIDRIGSKLGYAVSIVVWSIAACGHGLVRTTLGFGTMRALLGLGEAGNFPAAIKSVAEWFPKKERAFATGIFNSGANIAPVFTPPIVMWMLSNYGWHQAFVWTGALGFIWLIFWLIYYEIPARQKRVTQQEIVYINSDDEATMYKDPNAKIPLSKIVRLKEAWTFAVGKFFSDPIWWFYLFWIPSYFRTTYNIDLQGSWFYVSTIYFLASFGSIAGGYLSGWFIKRGWAVAKARKTALLIYASCVVPIIFVQYVTNAWIAVALIGLAASAHQAWSANLFTLVSDNFPKAAVGSVVGIGGMVGSFGSFLFPLFIGIVLDHFKALGTINSGYNIIFIICGCAYFVAWLSMHFISRIKQTPTL